MAQKLRNAHSGIRPVKVNGPRTIVPAKDPFFVDVEAGPIVFAPTLSQEDPSTESGSQLTGRTAGFVRFDTPSSSDGSISHSDRLSEQGERLRSDLRWVNPDASEGLTYQQVFDTHRVIRNGMSDVTGQIRPATHLLKTLKGRGADLDRGDAVGEGWFNYAENQRRARQRALAETPPSTPTKGRPAELSPDKGYAGDVGSECSPINLVYKRPDMPILFATAMREPVRFCMFNTGYMRKKDFWDFLKARLTPEVLQGIQKVQSVRQPNRTCRVDFWVDAAAAMGMKQALYLGSRQRRQGVRTDYRMPLYQLTDFWKPNKEMS